MAEPVTAGAFAAEGVPGPPGAGWLVARHAAASRSAISRRPHMLITADTALYARHSSCNQA